MEDTQTALNDMRTQSGSYVTELSQQGPVLLVFLRHFGCTFCREALADLAAQRKQFEESGVRIVFVHMSKKVLAERYFEKYDLAGVDHVSDPNCTYYQAFGLTKGNFNQLFGLQSWIRGFDAGVVQGHGVGYRQLGDGFQMPGAFSIRDGKVVDQFVHKVASDRPDYWSLLECCTLPEEVPTAM